MRTALRSRRGTARDDPWRPVWPAADRGTPVGRDPEAARIEPAGAREARGAGSDARDARAFSPWPPSTRGSARPLTSRAPRCQRARAAGERVAGGERERWKQRVQRPSGDARRAGFLPRPEVPPQDPPLRETTPKGTPFATAHQRAADAVADRAGRRWCRAMWPDRSAPRIGATSGIPAVTRPEPGPPLRPRFRTSARQYERDAEPPVPRHPRRPRRCVVAHSYFDGPQPTRFDGRT